MRQGRLLRRLENYDKADVREAAPWLLCGQGDQLGWADRLMQQSRLRPVFPCHALTYAPPALLYDCRSRQWLMRRRIAISGASCPGPSPVPG